MTFEKELKDLLNKHNCEKASGTPDFLLAQYIIESLKTFNKISNLYEKWNNWEDVEC